MLNFAFYVGSTATFLYFVDFDLYLNTAYAAQVIWAIKILFLKPVFPALFSFCGELLRRLQKLLKVCLVLYSLITDSFSQCSILL